MSIKTHKIIQQTNFADIDDEYRAFEEKFKPKKTTDDCYTPENVYNVVADWAAKKYGFDRSQIVRPFWPGGDYERFDYPEGCVVLDNPPFSILAQICRFYDAHGIRYFLFAPALTLFGGGLSRNYIVAACTIIYANGAGVNTSFTTNMGEYLFETAPDLRDALMRCNDKNSTAKELPKYEYPPCVAHAARINYLAVHKTHLAVKREDAVFIQKLDEQGDNAIFGGGFLLSERAAAERAAAERAAAERAAAERAAVERAAVERANRRVWKLSEREMELQRMIGKRADA